MSNILIVAASAAALSFLSWEDGLITELHETPCLNQDLKGWLAERFPGEPVYSAMNIKGGVGEKIEACFIRDGKGEDASIVILDVKDGFRAKVYLSQ